jgi:hypothetical protein
MAEPRAASTFNGFERALFLVSKIAHMMSPFLTDYFRIGIVIKMLVYSSGAKQRLSIGPGCNRLQAVK